jgi:phosphoenolpyruvate-protein kinase (PTS system EI component)
MPGRLIRGIPVSGGVAVGPALVVHWEVPPVRQRAIAPDQVDTEIGRLREALAFARERIQGVRERAAQRAGPEEARIFDAQLLILDDVELVSSTEQLIRENQSGPSS